MALVLGCVCASRAGASQDLSGEKPLAGGSESVSLDAAPQDSSKEPARWQVSTDGVLFGTFSRQGGRRGETEFRSQNWFMLMANRQTTRGLFTLTGMLSAEPVTATGAGYSEIFQEGEAYRGLQVTDRQHPHDLFMQLAAAWRIPLGTKTQITLAGGPVGQPTLGPVPFMHRPSASENPVAPLSHHIFDSTHTSSSVAMVRVDRPRLAFEGSLFHGREKDEHRYDLELGALDSWAVRGWFRPWPEWTVQASHGFLHEPEALEPGNQRRTNASVSWFRPRGSHYTAMLVAIGRNARQYSGVNSVLVEGTHGIGRWRTFGRFESTSVETEILLLPLIVHRPHPGELVDTIRATTLGAVRDIANVQALAVGVGADVTLYGVPSPLKITHGANPVSFRIFVRLTRADWRLRMWNETMGGHDGAGHVHHES